MEAKNRYVGMSVIKKDAKALLAGKPLYTDDIAPKIREPTSPLSSTCLNC